MIRLWHIGVVGLAATVALVIALALIGVGKGIPLLIYVLFIAALLFAWLVGRLRTALPAAPRFDTLISRPEPGEIEVEQLETVRRRVFLAGTSRADLFRLRPLVREIVATRLSRRWGVDLEREPERVRALLRDGPAWELVRPDPVSPRDPHAPGWSQRELERLVEELEEL
jgi:hypothetical protein